MAARLRRASNGPRSLKRSACLDAEKIALEYMQHNRSRNRTVRSTGGAIWLLRVAPISGLPDDHTRSHEAAQSIQRIADELSRGGVEEHPVTREGDAAQEILHLSSETAADVIVMRTPQTGQALSIKAIQYSESS